MTRDRFRAQHETDQPSIGALWPPVKRREFMVLYDVTSSFSSPAPFRIDWRELFDEPLRRRLVRRVIGTAGIGV
jgi:hypothetical protein